MTQWKTIAGDPDYEVSDDGRVKSLARYVGARYWPERILRPYLTGKGPQYMTVQIRGKQRKVHRLVAEAFLPAGPGQDQVNHISGDTSDNRAQNLEWCTAKQNIAHAYTYLGRKSLGGHKGKTGAKHHASKMVIAFPPDSFCPQYFGSGSEAARAIGCAAGTVPRTCGGEQPFAKGWALAYA